MRTITKILFVAIAAVAVMSCRDRAAEKRIAQLESRLSELESNKPAAQTTPAATPDATPAPAAKPDGPLPVLKFERTTYDFGAIKEGDKVSYTYKFTNSGEAPLIVESVQPSCGCTAPDWSKDPIPVNGSGFVKVEFDSHGKTGIQQKTVTVNANTWPKTMVLRFTAQVLPKPEGAGPVK